jgi:hypothetical protein
VNLRALYLGFIGVLNQHFHGAATGNDIPPIAKVLKLPQPLTVHLEF